MPISLVLQVLYLTGGKNMIALVLLLLSGSAAPAPASATDEGSAMVEMQRDAPGERRMESRQDRDNVCSERDRHARPDHHDSNDRLRRHERPQYRNEHQRDTPNYLSLPMAPTPPPGISFHIVLFD